jgi:uncharacterized membrane protein
MQGRFVVGIMLLPLLVAAGGHDHGCGGGGAPTEAACDPSLTWENFGQSFMSKYCIACHAEQRTGGGRRGAPADHNYDTEAGVFADPDHVALAAGAGPLIVNDSMPPYGPEPTREEREQLAAWLACATEE